MELKQIVGNQLRKRREQLNITQSELGKICNITREQVNRLEKGNNIPGLDVLIKAAKLFNVGLEYFIEDINLPDEQAEKLLTVYHLLDQKQKDELLNYAEYLKSKNI
jgi:transcriptional regulator with XRE-family HTH domain